MTAVANATPRSYKKRVSFLPYVAISMIPPVDPETKHLQYYSRCELLLIENEVKRQILELRNLMEERKKDEKRALAIVVVEKTDRPMKRLRATVPAVAVPAV